MHLQSFPPHGRAWCPIPTMLIRVCHHNTTCSRCVAQHGLYIFCDQKYYCAGHGYGYVAASRFRTRGACYLYGHMRRTEFLPVGGEGDDGVLERGYDSLSDDDEDVSGLDYACEGNSDIFDGFADIKDLVAKDDDIDFQ